MDAVIIGRIALETAIPEGSVSAAAALFERGATGPFVVHYRKEATGGLDEGRIRSIQERIAYYRELWDQRAAVLKMLSEQDKLTEELKARIENCFSKAELDDLYHQFRPRRKTRAIDAAEKGLEPLAEYFWNQELDAWSVEEHIDVFVDPAKGISTREQALQGVVDIIAEWIWANIEYRKTLRDMLWSEGALISSVVPAKVGQKTKYNMYYDRRESVTAIPSHRVLAIRRGCKEGILISSIEGDNSKALDFLLKSVIKETESIFAPVLEAAVKESYSRLLRPLIETEVRTQLKERADREAIKVFQENLANLLLTPPAGPIVVMGIDWGKGDECNVAVVDEAGKFLEGAKIRFSSRAKASGAKREPEPETPPPDSKPGKAQAQPDAENPAAAPAKPPEPPSGETAPPDASTLQAEAPEEVGEKSLDEPSESRDPKAEAIQTPPAESSATIQEQSETEALDVSVLSDTTLIPENETRTEESAPAENSEIPIVAPASESPETSASSGEAPGFPSIAQDPAMTEVGTAESSDKSASAEIPPASESPEISASSGEAPGFPSTARDPAMTEAVTAESSDKSASAEILPATMEETSESEPETGESREALRDLIARHNIKAIAIGTGTGARELETALRRIVEEESLGDLLIAAVNDAGIAIYSSSRIAREEFPDRSASMRCAISLARRLQDPLAELVKIDPKLIGVGQYQHDVDQKELHRGLLQAVQYCVNKVGVNVNTASESLLRYVSGLNDKLARRLVAYRTAHGSFRSRASILSAVGIDEFAYQQAAGFLRIPDGDNPLDRTAVHPESYPIVEKMASALGVEVANLIENKELIASLKLEDFGSESTGIPTLNDIREELLRPGRDPRKTFRVPKFRADVKDISDLKPGMALEGTVTNVTNFGAFVDIGVRQDGLVHLSQMSNRFIRDPREAVKVGDVVQVKVISVESETKRIGLSMKAMLPNAQRRRKKQQRRGARRPAHGSQSNGRSGGGNAEGASSAPGSESRQKSNRSYQGSPRNRRKGPRKPGNPDASQQHKESESETPEPSLQEKIAILQSKFRRIN